MASCRASLLLLLLFVGCAAGGAAGVEPIGFVKHTIDLGLPITPPLTSTDPTVVVISINTAIAAVTPLVSAFSSPSLQISNRGAADDCAELHGLSLDALQRAGALVGGGERSRYVVSTIRIQLSAALTNRATCVDGLSGAAGPTLKPLLAEVGSAYQHVTDALAMVSSANFQLPIGTTAENDDNVDGGGGEGQYAAMITVAQNGSGDYRTVSEAVAAAPNKSPRRTLIFIKAGVYEEHVEIPARKTNIVFLGDGRDVTIITGNRSFGDGWTTYRSATVAVAGEGFLARDVTFRNTAGAAKFQAVALRVNADLVALYRCGIDGYQDTLYAHSFRQFYRECYIAGTVDFIFGNAAAVIQGCNITAKLPLPGQQNMVTAQGRDDPNEDTGISIHHSTIAAAQDLAASSSPASTFLGRPWKTYSRTVYMESYIGGLVDPAGWHVWSGSASLNTLYYGEYDNAGPGAGLAGRVTWPGYHVLNFSDATEFSVANFIDGEEWLDSTSFPYDADI